MTIATENIPIPTSMKDFIEAQLPASGVLTVAENVCGLIRKDQILKAEAQLCDMILDGQGLASLQPGLILMPWKLY